MFALPVCSIDYVTFLDRSLWLCPPVSTALAARRGFQWRLMSQRSGSICCKWYCDNEDRLPVLLVHDDLRPRKLLPAGVRGVQRGWTVPVNDLESS